MEGKKHETYSYISYPAESSSPSKENSEIQDLISAFYECGYEWNDEQQFFFNEELDICIKVSSLNIFRPQDIRECWGNKDYLKEQGRLKVLTKIGCGSILVIPLAILICFIYNWKAGMGLAVMAVAALMISDKIKRGVLTQRQKREGTWVDRKLSSGARTVGITERSKDGKILKTASGLEKPYQTTCRAASSKKRWISGKHTTAWKEANEPFIQSALKLK